MNNSIFPPLTASEETFFSVIDWPLNTIDTLMRYRFDYQTTPDYKKIMLAMTDANQMYQPLRKSSLRPDIFGELTPFNEYRKAQRAQLYMYKKDLIETVDERGEKRLVLTTRGHKMFYKDYPLSKLKKKKWDGFWTLVFYDFPEKLSSRRKFFRSRLIKYGFGSPQISILASPLELNKPLQELVEGDRLQEYVWVTRTKGILGMTDRQIAEASWPLTEINDLYKRFITCLELVKKADNSGLAKEGWIKLCLCVLAKDPHLPDELLPKDWYADECRNNLSKYNLVDLIRSFL